MGTSVAFIWGATMFFPAAGRSARLCAALFHDPFLVHEGGSTLSTRGLWNAAIFTYI